MKIKSLLIGSAAAIVAAPAAFAADVIIAEPEPVEYVEVCDVAGAGYFYIPGSRTCIQLSGLVRHELSFVETEDDLAFDGNGINSLVRGELNIRTFTETELGDLTSFIRFRANDKNANPLATVFNTEDGERNVEGASDNGAVFLNNATIGLGGLLMGLSDTLYDGGIAGEFDSFGGDRVHFIRYTADLGAFSASIGVEAERENTSRLDYVPNVVGKVSGDLGAFSIDLFAAYDDEDDAGGILTGLVDEDEFALKAIAGVDIGAFAVDLGATYNSGESYYDNGFEYSVGASATIGLGEKASFTFGGQYFANALEGTVAFEDSDGYSVGANVDYEIVDGFDVKLAVTYVDKDGVGDVDVFDANNVLVETVRGSVDNDGFFTGFIRFDRSF